jgi:hypothetical protein
MIWVALNLLLDLGRFFLRAGLLIASPLTNHPGARKYPENVVNGNSGQAVGYLARLGSILVRQTFSVLAAGPDRAIVQDLNLKE